MSEPSSSPADSARRWDWNLCLGVTTLAALLHLVNLFSAGALWRDEAGGVQLATTPSVREMWQMLARDSFPAFFPGVLRVWSAVGLGSGDFGLRLLGCLVGLALLGVLWLNSRASKGPLPVLSLVLFALNPVVIRWGDSLRAYGFGTLFILLTFGWVWAFVCQPTARRFALASIGGVLSVQCLYQNAFLLLVLCAVAALICLRRQRAAHAGLALALGLPAAFSLLPYVPLIRESQRWWIVEQTGFRPLAVGGTLWDALSSPPLLGPLLWLGLLGAAVVLGFQSFEAPGRRRRPIEEDLPVLGALTASGALLVFGAFVAFSGLPTQPWYWLSLIGLLAVCFDAISARFWSSPPRWSRAVLVAMIFLAAAFAAVPLTRRMTNVDRLASKVSELAQPSDLVVVYPWYCGVSFNRYYQGAAGWTTVPELSDHRFHRYDLLKEKLRGTQPLQSVGERIRQTLIAGNTVWIVGGLPPAPPGGAAPVALPPAPDGPDGWYDEPYNASWGVQLAYTLQTQAQSSESIPFDIAPRVERYEHLALTRARGYRGTVFTQPP